jgi:hypothetical protein
VSLIASQRLEGLLTDDLKAHLEQLELSAVPDLIRELRQTEAAQECNVRDAAAMWHEAVGHRDFTQAQILHLKARLANEL